MTYSTGENLSSPRMYTIYRQFKNDPNHNNGHTHPLNSSQPKTKSSILLNLILPAVSNMSNRRRISLRWAYPSPRSYQIDISRAENSIGTKS